VRQSIQGISNNSNTRKSRIENSVKTKLPQQQIIKNVLDRKQIFEFQEAQRAAIIMRKLEYSKGTCHKKKIIKHKDHIHDVIHPIHNHNNYHANNRTSNIHSVLNKKNSFGKILEEVEFEDKEDNADYNNLKYFKQQINASYFNNDLIVKIQRWWRSKSEILMKIKFLQHNIRVFLFNRHYFKKFQKLISHLFILFSICKKILKRVSFDKIISHSISFKKDYFSKIIRIQTKTKRYLKMIKQRKYNCVLRKLDILNRLLLKFSLKDEKIKKNLLQFYGLVKASEKEFHEIKLNGLNKFYAIQKEKDEINVEMQIKSIRSNRSSMKEFIVNSLGNVDLGLNNSNKSKQIILKSSSRNFLNEENLENKLIRVSSYKKNQTSEDIMKSRLEKVKAKRVNFVIDDEDENSACYNRSCKCNIY